MEYRLVPPPGSIERLHAIRETVPSDPNAVEDCCAHLIEHTDISSRTVAEQWLVFLRALGLVATDGGRYYRTEQAIDRSELCVALQSNIAGATAIADWLSSNRLADHDEKKVAEDEIERLYQAVESDLPRTVRDGESDSQQPQVTGKEYVSRVGKWIQTLC